MMAANNFSAFASIFSGANKTEKTYVKLYLNSDTERRVVCGFCPLFPPSPLALSLAPSLPISFAPSLISNVRGIVHLNGDVYTIDNFLLLPSHGEKNSITSLKSFSLRLVARKWHTRIKCGHLWMEYTPYSSPHAIPFNLSQNLSANALRIRKPLDGECQAMWSSATAGKSKKKERKWRLDA